MGLPPNYPLATDKVNATLRQDDHPAHHNDLAADVNWLGEQIDAGVSRTPIEWTLPTGAIAQNLPRNGAMANVNLLNNGRLFLSAQWLEPGDLVSTVTCWAGTTGSTGLSNSWASLWGPDATTFPRLAVSNNDTSEWVGEAKRVFTMAVPYAVTTAGLYRIGLTVAVATTMPTIRGNASVIDITDEPPILSGGSTSTGLTNPASAPATAAYNTGANGSLYFIVG